MDKLIAQVDRELEQLQAVRSMFQELTSRRAAWVPDALWATKSGWGRGTDAWEAMMARGVDADVMARLREGAAAGPGDRMSEMQEIAAEAEAVDSHAGMHDEAGDEHPHDGRHAEHHDAEGNPVPVRLKAHVPRTRVRKPHVPEPRAIGGSIPQAVVFVKPGAAQAAHVAPEVKPTAPAPKPAAAAEGTLEALISEVQRRTGALGGVDVLN